MNFNDKIVVITGAASGMGRETSILFARKGYTSICTDINMQSLHETVKIIKKDGGRATGIVADITKVDDIKKIAKEVESKYKRLDVLINCAGLLGGIHDLVDYSEKNMDLIIDVNQKGTYRCCKYILPIMIKSKGEIIINIGSLAGKIGCASVSLYNASKWGIIGFTKSLAEEVRKYGIKVVIINPGSTETNFSNQPDDTRNFTRDFLDKCLKPIDIARACLFVVEQSKNCIIKEMDVFPMGEKLVPMLE